MIELIVATAVVALITIPVVMFLTQGMRTNTVANRQFNQTDKTYRILRQVVEGTEKSEGFVPGLRTATAVATNGGLSFATNSMVVTYYSQDDRLYRKTCDPLTPGCAPEDPVDPNGGTEILTNVVDFGAAPDGADTRLITVRLEVFSPSRGAGSSDTGIRLVTRVIVRNLP